MTFDTNHKVIVKDLSNYAVGEKTPFEGVLYQITTYPNYWVRSSATNKEYELYEFQFKLKEDEKIISK